MIKLFDYFRSSACYRVRIALNLKNIAYQKETVHLTNNGGEQHSEAYRNLNPQGLIPSIQDHRPGGVFTLHQSLAILEYLEEQYPQPPLLPKDSLAKSVIRSLCYKICCDIHPLNNLRVLKYLEEQLEVDEEKRLNWYDHWIVEGFDAIEAEFSNHENGKYCFGDQPTLADVCLVPQVYNAKRFHVDLTDYPKIIDIYNRCMDNKAFHDARPIEAA